MTDILDGFDERTDRMAAEQAQRLRAARLSTGPLTPEQAARANTLSDRQGKPFGVVAANLDAYEEDQRLADVSAVGERSPAVGEFLTDPRRMALAGDDAEAMARFASAYGEGFSYAAGLGKRKSQEPGFSATPTNYLQELIGALVGGQRRGVAYLGELIPDLGSERTKAIEETVARGLGYGSRADHAAARTGAYLADVERQAQGAEVSSPETQAHFERLAQANETDSLLEAIGLVASSPRAIGTTVASSLGMGAPQLAMTTATGGMGRLATAGTAGGGSAVVEYGASLSEAMASDGVDTTDPYAVSAFLRDPEKMAAAKERAATRGVAVGVFDALTAGLAGIFINNARRGITSAALRTGAEGAMQIAGGMAGEASAQLATGEELQFGDILVEGVAELPFGAVETWSNYRTARNAGRVRWINERMDQIMRATTDSTRLKAATDAAAGMQLGKRSPEDVAAFVDQIGGGEDVVYLPAEAAQTLFQSDELLNLAGSADELAEQLARGELAIPMPQWMSIVPQHANKDEIVRRARTDVDGMSAHDLDSVDMEELAREFGATDEAAERARPGEEDSRKRVHDDVMGQLLATERFGLAEAEVNAKVWAERFGTLGRLLGQDPFTLYERYMSGIGSNRADGRPDPRASKPFTGSAYTDALLDSIRDTEGGPSEKQQRGPSVVAWLVANGGVQDTGGELRGMDAGRLRPGLVNRAGMAPDRARELLAEAGYIPDGTGLDALFDAIDSEFRGTPIYSDQEGSPARQRFASDRAEMLAAIEDNPTLRDMPREQFAALTNQQIVDMLSGGTVMDQGRPGSSPSNPLPTEEMDSAPVGAWVRGFAPESLGVFPNVFQVREVPVDQVTGVEFDSAGRLIENRQPDADRYAEAMREGQEFPNLHGYELEDGRVQITDGHRRLTAVRQAGRDTIRIAVMPADANMNFDQPAFHGTGASVDRFSLQKIGTGEGANAYGWGLYFASQRDIADFYRRNQSGIARNVAATMGDKALQDAGGDRARAVQSLTRKRDAMPEAARGTTQAAIDWLRRGQGTGNLYQVEVPDSEVLLDWDKPLNEQPEHVREAVASALNAAGMNAEAYAESDGMEIYRDLAWELGGTEGHKAASESLFAAGVPGLQYQDGEGSSNFVIWDEAAISEPVRLFQSGDAGVGIESNPNFRRWSNDAPLVRAGEAETHDFKSGQKVVVEGFHGTKRPDRIGTRFRKGRATSGPMAFFTSNPEIASSYAQGKHDTSIELDQFPFESWFKFKPKGSRSPVDIVRAWYFLDADQKAKIRELAPQVTRDDAGENIVVEAGNEAGLGNYDYELSASRTAYDRAGNPLKAMLEGWLNGGTLYGNEQRFMQVLELAGFPVDQVTFDSPYAEFPAVYPVYLEMQRPLVTSDVPQEVADALNSAAKRDRSRPKYERGADAWDKNTVTLREWVEWFNKANNDMAWTSIPDKVTKLFTELGYDGIIDNGGKRGGQRHKVYIPFDDTQVKSQFNRGTFDSSSNILNQSDQPFYSALLRTVEEGRGAPKRGDAAAWKGWLDGAQRRGDIRKAERDWLGLDAWLDAQDGHVTREQLTEFVRANQVEVQEVTLGEASAEERNERQREIIGRLEREYGITGEDDGDGGTDWVTLADDFPVDDWPAGAAALRDEWISHARDEMESGGQVKFEGYQLPGGENYRELLLTLPPAQITPAPVDTNGWTVQTVSDADHYRYTGQREIRVRDARGDVVLSRYGFSGTDERAIADAADSLLRADASDQRDARNFRSSHFDQPNILAHVRFNERTDADGKRVLFIEEIQSDWHQAGRKRGYSTYRVAEEVHNGKTYYKVVNEAGETQAFAGGGVSLFSDEAAARRSMSGLDAVPNAPFKATDEWAMLAFKRMVRHAAENGFDRIAWTTGEQQAARYDLSKQVDTIAYAKDQDGLVTIEVFKDGRNQFNRRGMSMEEVEATVGKEVAQKIADDGGELNMRTGYSELSGLDLQVGGEGMKGFYDNILPKAVNKWAKKLGGKVGEASIDTGLEQRTKAGGLTSEQKSDLRDLAKRVREMDYEEFSEEYTDITGLVITEDQYDDLSDMMRDPSRRAGAVSGFVNGTNENLKEAPKGLVSVHSLDMTDAMREAALSGQALFQREQGSKAPRGQIEIFPDRRMAISLFEGADRSTFMHESGHFFLEVFKDIAAQEDAPQQIKADMDGLVEWFSADPAKRREEGAKIARGAFRPVRSGSEWVVTSPLGHKRVFAKEAAAADYAAAERAKLVQAVEALTDTDIAALADQFRTGLEGDVGSVFNTVFHEQYARGWELYLAEGRAPSEALQSVFSKFKVWIQAVYKFLTRLDVQLTDEVRGIMDRMLASEEEIAAANARAAAAPLAADQAAASALGMDDAQFADYRALVDKAAEEAKAEVLAKLVQAQDRETKAWWKEERAKVKAEVEAEYEAMPVYRAVRVLSGAENLPDGTPIPDEMRVTLDRASLAEVYGDAYLRRLKGLYRKKGGVSQDDAAMVLGFASGDDLVKALANRGDMKARIEAETDARMRERHGDPRLDGQTPQLAMDAIHGRSRLELLDRELEVLARRAGQPAPLRRAITAVARELIARKTPRKIKPAEYLTAERKAAREAAAAAARGDYAAALAAKRQQAFNAAMYAEGRKAQDEFEVHARYLQRMSDKPAQARLGKAGQSYQDQVNQLLEQVEVRPVSGRQVERRARLAEWVAEQESAGNPVNIPQRLLDEAGLTNIRDMSLADLREVVSAIKQIAHLAKTKNRLTLAGQERDAEEVDQEMSGSVLAAYETRPERTGDPTRGETIARKTQELDIQRVMPTNIARELDGYEEGGAVWRNVIQPVRDAMYGKVMPETKKMQHALADLLRQHYSPAELRRMDEPVWRAAVGDTWSRGRILSLAMNWGSDGNREAILGQARSRLTPDQVGTLLATLDARDYAFAQAVVDQINAYWPQIAETQRRRTGLVPEKVKPAPYTVVTADGKTVEFKGGYYPLKYDAERSGYGATLQEMDDAYNNLRVGRTASAATKNGHTKERVGSGGKTVMLGLDIAGSHMRDVIRDLYLGDAVAYVHKVLHGKRFKDAVTATGKREYLKALDLWLKDVASGELGARSVLESVAAFIRQNLTAAVLTYKAGTALLQVTGLFQTGAVLGTRHTLKGAAKLLSKSWLGPNSIWNDIRAQSPFMAERFGQVPDAVLKVANARAGKLSAGWASMIRWGYVPMGRMQMIADAATWLAAKDKALRENGGDEAAAIAFADDSVIRLQAPETFIEKAAVSRGTLNENVRQTELVKATTMLLTYMIAKGNVQREMFQRAGGNTGSFARNLRGIAVSPRNAMGFGIGMIQLFVLESMFMDALRNGLPEDDDDDGWVLDDWLAYLAEEIGLGTLSTIPAVSQLATAGRGYDAQGPLEKAWSGAVRSVTTLLANLDDEEELGREDLKAIINVAGISAGFPSSAANTAVDALWRVHDGEDVSPIEFIILPERPRDE